MKFNKLNYDADDMLTKWNLIKWRFIENSSEEMCWNSLKHSFDSNIDNDV